MERTTRERALDLVEEARAVTRLHPHDMWSRMMRDQADMIEKLVSQLDDQTLQ